MRPRQPNDGDGYKSKVEGERLFISVGQSNKEMLVFFQDH